MSADDAMARERVEVSIEGTVQGVGFRPFVYRLADELGVAGWAANTPDGVLIDAEAGEAALAAFLERLRDEKPAHATIRAVRSRALTPTGARGFAIRPSTPGGAATAEILPDLATCPACLADIRDPSNRRHRYPFTNCTYCGPRFTIVLALPYDRANTTMRGFPLCPECRAEYEDPRDRRFHAQPTACPACGPQLTLWSATGAVTARRDEALAAAAALLRNGAIVAVKGVGGFHLMVDARDDAAVRRLRERKRRGEKPFAVMFPDVAAIRRSAALSPGEEALVTSPAAPIVLLRRAGDAGVSPSAAPGTPDLGVFLPSNPLQHLLLAELGFPVVATSGNLSEEPIAIGEQEALRRLAGVADAFLVHDRPIRRPCDDSVARVVEGGPLLLRRARGYAPAPIPLHRVAARPLLAVGAHQKSTVGLFAGTSVVLSQHIGDLSGPHGAAAFRHAIASLRELYPADPGDIACDLHPDYLSTRFAHAQGVRVRGVQHHYAHVASCMAEHGLDGSVLGVAWDGTGFGPDGTIWGGEFLRTRDGGFERAASFRTFPLVGAEAAMREPRRAALGVLVEAFGDAAFDRDDLAALRAFTAAERRLLRRAITRPALAPRTSSVGRLFDAVASILGLRQRSTFEGEAAMALEHLSAPGGAPYPFTILPRASDGVPEVDWTPMVRALCEPGTSPADAAGRFHATLASIIVDVARRVGEGRVVLTGGCFQNADLLHRAVAALRAAGFQPFWHSQVPPNDGGIALGQLYACVLEDQAREGG